MTPIKDSNGNLIHGILRTNSGAISVNNKTELDKYRLMVKKENDIKSLTSEVNDMKKRMQQMEELFSKFTRDNTNG